MIKVNSWTNHGKVLFIDTISESVPDPLCKVSSTNACTARLSQLTLIDRPQWDIDNAIERDKLNKVKTGLLKEVASINKKLEELA